MKRWVMAVTMALVVTMLAGPLLLAPTGLRRLPEAEQRRPNAMPVTVAPLDAAWTGSVGDAITDRLAGPGLGVEAVAQFDFHLARRAPGDKVIRGREEMLYYRLSTRVPCMDEVPLDVETAAVRRLSQATQDRGLRLVLIVIPDKVAAVPDGLPAAFHRAGSCVRARAVAAEEMLVAELGQNGMAVVENLSDPDAWFAEDTHYAPAGRLAVQRELVEALQPGMWSPAAVEHVPSTRQLDLRSLMGLPGQIKYTDHRLAYAATSESVVADVGGDQETILVRSRPHPGLSLVDGSTLVIHDSFIQGWRKDFQGLFEDATFVHWGSLDAEGVTSLLSGHDTVVVELVGRTFWGRGGSDARLNRLAERLTALAEDESGSS